MPCSLNKALKSPRKCKQESDFTCTNMYMYVSQCFSTVIADNKATLYYGGRTCTCTCTKLSVCQGREEVKKSRNEACLALLIRSATSFPCSSS